MFSPVSALSAWFLGHFSDKITKSEAYNSTKCLGEFPSPLSPPGTSLTTMKGMLNQRPLGYECVYECLLNELASMDGSCKSLKGIERNS